MITLSQAIQSWAKDHQNQEVKLATGKLFSSYKKVYLSYEESTGWKFRKLNFFQRILRTFTCFRFYKNTLKDHVITHLSTDNLAKEYAESSDDKTKRVINEISIKFFQKSIEEPQKPNEKKPTDQGTNTDDKPQQSAEVPSPPTVPQSESTQVTSEKPAVGPKTNHEDHNPSTETTQTSQPPSEVKIQPTKPKEQEKQPTALQNGNGQSPAVSEPEPSSTENENKGNEFKYKKAVEELVTTEVDYYKNLYQLANVPIARPTRPKMNIFGRLVMLFVSDTQQSQSKEDTDNGAAQAGAMRATNQADRNVLTQLDIMLKELSSELKKLTDELVKAFKANNLIQLNQIYVNKINNIVQLEIQTEIFRRQKAVQEQLIKLPREKKTNTLRIKVVNDPGSKKREPESFLIMPVQRWGRRLLLFQQIVQNCTDQKTKEMFNQTLILISNLLNETNEKLPSP